MKVSFDKNIYEHVVDPDKGLFGKGHEDKEAYYKINAAIKSGGIEPFISETILTIETIDKNDRKHSLTRKDRLTTNVISHDSNYQVRSSVSIKPNHEIYPENKDHYQIYLPIAIELGFKILPSYRLEKIVNPYIKPEWYYVPPQNEPFEIPNKFSSIVSFIEAEGFGFAALKKLIDYQESENKSWVDYLEKYTGNSKSLQEKIAEWSDGDSIAIHIACGIKYFCTNDGAFSDKTKSVFSKKMKTKLIDQFDIEFVTPIELSKLIS